MIECFSSKLYTHLRVFVSSIAAASPCVKKKKKGDAHSSDPHTALKQSSHLASSVTHPKFTTSVMLKKGNMDNIYKYIQSRTSTLNTLAKIIHKQGEYLSQTFGTSLPLGHTLCTRTHTAFADQHTSNGGGGERSTPNIT